MPVCRRCWYRGPSVEFRLVKRALDENGWYQHWHCENLAACKARVKAAKQKAKEAA